MAVSAIMRIDDIGPADVGVLEHLLRAEAERDGDCRSCSFRSTRGALITQQVWGTQAGFLAYRDRAVASALQQAAPAGRCSTAAFWIPDMFLPAPAATALRALVPEQSAPPTSTPSLLHS